MKGAISKCQQLVDSTPDAFCLQQFDNPANPEVHYKTTGPEIWRDSAGKVDFLVAGHLPLPVSYDSPYVQHMLRYCTGFINRMLLCALLMHDGFLRINARPGCSAF